MSAPKNTGDVWTTAADGGRYWGAFGAAGLLAIDRDRFDGAGAVLLQHRAEWSDHGGTWGIPGGALHEGERAITGAIRESQEEAGVPDNCLRPRYTHVSDRGGWTYTTVIAEVTAPFEPTITDAESLALAWTPLTEVANLPLHPGFAATWDLLLPLLAAPPAVVVDAANVIGSVPDGWWKDRRGAAERMRERLELLATRKKGVRAGFVGAPESKVPGLDRAFPDWIMVAEGPARGIATGSNVEVVSAPGLGDDTITDETVSRINNGALVAVITGDAELRNRVESAGAAAVHGPTKLLRMLPEAPTM